MPCSRSARKASTTGIARHSGCRAYDFPAHKNPGQNKQDLSDCWCYRDSHKRVSSFPGAIQFHHPVKACVPLFRYESVYPQNYTLPIRISYATIRLDIGFRWSPCCPLLLDLLIWGKIPPRLLTV